MEPDRDDDLNALIPGAVEAHSAFAARSRRRDGQGTLGRYRRPQLTAARVFAGAWFLRPAIRAVAG